MPDRHFRPLLGLATLRPPGRRLRGSATHRARCVCEAAWYLLGATPFARYIRLNQLFDYDPKYEGFDLRYPSPPRVHWLVLLLAWFGIQWAIALTVPAKWSGITTSLVFDGWVFYLCNWIRTLDPEAKSPFWCDVYVVVELVCAALVTMKHPGQIAQVIAVLLGLASGILAIATVFVIKSDLEHHYNDREHAGLVLSGVTTFFFSFLYFQYHLYDIANRRKRVAEAMGANAYTTQSS
jgi:hypothetical protein